MNQGPEIQNSQTDEVVTPEIVEKLSSCEVSTKNEKLFQIIICVHSLHIST